MKGSSGAKTQAKAKEGKQRQETANRLLSSHSLLSSAMTRGPSASRPAGGRPPATCPPSEAELPIYALRAGVVGEAVEANALGPEPPERLVEDEA